MKLHTAAIVGVCVPLVASCSAAGFGAPTRHAIANLQAADVNVGNNLLVRGLIVALPEGNIANRGGVAYIEFTATNLGNQSDQLQTASAQIAGPLFGTASGSAAPASPAASGSSDTSPQYINVSSQQLPVSNTEVPAKTSAAPGVLRVVVALDPLEVPLAAGESVRVSLQFANNGAVDDINVPVLGADAVGSSFLPSAPPSLPSSAAPSSPAGSAPASSPASAPVSAPASAPVSAPASSPAA
jgi:hypothetical protein